MITHGISNDLDDSRTTTCGQPLEALPYEAKITDDPNRVACPLAEETEIDRIQLEPSLPTAIGEQFRPVRSARTKVTPEEGRPA